MNLKLNKLSQSVLNKREMKEAKGGNRRSCGCGCNYEGRGGSSTANNGMANYNGGKDGLWSPGGARRIYVTKF